MKIALDYDKTFTNDRSLFSLFVEAAMNKGHDIKFVTARHSQCTNKDIKRDAANLGIDIIYTDGRKKQPVMEEFFWIPDVWIDDDPSNIVATRRPAVSDLI